MARARNIKPGFFTNDVLAEASPLARILFAGLWCFADREGRLQDRPKKIKAEILPYDQCDADELLKSLESLGFILRYEVDGTRFIQVLNFNKHQNPHVKEQASDIPAPCKPGASPVQEQCKSDEIPEVAGLIPDSLNPLTDSIEKHLPEKSPAFAFPKEIPDQLANDFMKLRKAKKSPVTKTALDGIEREAMKAGLSLLAALEMCCQRGWAGFKAEWVTSDNARASPSRPEKFDPVAFVNQGRKQPGGGNDGFINGTAERVA